MTSPVIFVHDAGHGETPAVPDAKFKRGDVVRWTGKREGIVLVAIPPGFSPDYALADLMSKPRPLMIRDGARGITYICYVEGDTTPWLLRERQLRATGETREIGTITAERSQ